MSALDASSFFCPIRPLDLSTIEAVGFDLDHTLALYDDHAVNLLAARETAPILESAGHADASFPTEDVTTTARGLSMDLRHGNVIKIGADGGVMMARRGEDWLSDHAIAASYDGHDPTDEATTWHVNSPFDIPTLWFFSTLGPRIRDPKDAAYAGRVLGDIRRSLDRSHTHGELKRHITRDLSRFVSPAGKLIPGLERWKRQGKRLFVVTNSDPVYAGHVLDHVLGRDWQDLFDLVLTDAGKPRFFTDAYSDRPPRESRVNAHVLDHAHASHVEARLGVEPSRILYAGDNARTDIAPALRRGWRTVHVVAELAARDQSTPWAGALLHRGTPTWFAKTIHDHADAACARIDAFLALDPQSRVNPTEDFYSRIAASRLPDAAGNAP
jgi:HAD superfamily 5'-nucleotidase-like hydrolase